MFFPTPQCQGGIIEDHGDNREPMKVPTENERQLPLASDIRKGGKVIATHRQAEVALAG